jgi:hypothetical protein
MIRNDVPLDVFTNHFCIMEGNRHPCTDDRAAVPAVTGRFQKRPLVLSQLLLLLLLVLSSTSASADDVNVTLSDDATEPIDSAPPRFAVLFPWFIQVIGVITFFIITRYELIIPFQAIMFMIGAACGIVSTIRYNDIDPTTTDPIESELDQLSISILQWSTIDSAVLLLVFLPGLIFRDAIEGKFSTLLSFIFKCSCVSKY